MEGNGEFLSPTPCRCAGERAAVHARCLLRWQATAFLNRQWDSGRTCHACKSEYKVRYERVPIGILGGTGLVGRQLAARLREEEHGLFSVGMVAGSSRTIGRSLADVWKEKESALEEHYGKELWPAAKCPPHLEDIVVVGAEKLAECEIVVSAIAPSLGHIEDSLRDAGVAVFSISPHDRENTRNPLVVPEVNYQLLGSCDDGTQLPLFKSPNCVVCGTSIVLAALDKAFDVSAVNMTTFQALSGRGDAKYTPADLVVGNVYPLAGTVERTDDFQRAELKRLFPRIEKLSVASHRVPVRNGHFIRVGCRLRRLPKSIQEVEDCLTQFQPLRGKGLPSSPKHPIVLCDSKTVGGPRPAHDSRHHGGMAVCVGQLRLGDQEDFFDLSFSLVVNNLVRGAYGAALLTAEMYQLYYKRQQRPPLDFADAAASNQQQLAGSATPTAIAGTTVLSGSPPKMSSSPVTTFLSAPPKRKKAYSC